jgi:glycerate dehydrogenase
MTVMTMRIVFLDRSTFHRDIEFDPASVSGAVWRNYPTTAAHELSGRLADTDVIVTNKVKLNGEVLTAHPGIKLIAVAATGVDHVDLVSARQLGIAVSNVSGYAVHTVSEHVFALLLALRRQIRHYATASIDGHWSRSGTFCLQTWPIEELAGSTLGIVGAGANGASVAALASAFGMRVLLAERRGAASVRNGRVPFEHMLAEADVVSLHVPLTDETRHLIGTSELARMKSNALLINTARGGVVDEAALLTALQDGRIAGAALDVLANEPPPPEHPLLRANLPNLILTPHIAWASRQAQQKLADEVIANIAAYQRGEFRNRVT